MNLPVNDPGKQPDETESLRQAELRRMVQEYIDNLRELIKKLRRKLH
jgi:hypothetical protein